MRPIVLHTSNTSKILVAIPSTSSFSSFRNVVNLYSSATKSIVDIQNVFNVPIIGSASINISYTTNITSSIENIFIDTTSTSSFWNDIENWMFLNNFVGIVQSGSNYYIDDDTNSSFLYIINNG